MQLKISIKPKADFNLWNHSNSSPRWALGEWYESPERTPALAPRHTVVSNIIKKMYFTDKTTEIQNLLPNRGKKTARNFKYSQRFLRSGLCTLFSYKIWQKTFRLPWIVNCFVHLALDGLNCWATASTAGDGEESIRKKDPASSFTISTSRLWLCEEHINQVKRVIKSDERNSHGLQYLCLV